MKVAISYPPLANEKGCPTLGQNRQFQYFKDPTYIYPVVPATAATLLKNAGHEAVWNDCLAEGLNREAFFSFLERSGLELIAFETKTPVVKQHWSLINEIKERFPKLCCVLFGDHVTALPKESFENSRVDFVLAGGDYDFLLLNLCDTLRAGSGNLQACLEPGIYWRDKEEVKSNGPFKLDHDLDTLPFINRDLTKWQLYAFKNGNYKRTPGTYIMSGRDCWWGKCTFCGWGHFYPRFRQRKPSGVLDEIGALVERYGVREIMDDTGSFPVGGWLREFCQGMIAQGFNRKVYLDCNMRFGTLGPQDFALMKKANFRLLLFGLESANQATLDRINKNLRVQDVIDGCREASAAGLYPHITIMFGYPWETYDDARKTLELGRWLLKKGYAYTMQATMVIPYPGTPLFEECRQKGWLETLDWDRYDMKEPVMRAPIPPEKIPGLVQGMYGVAFQPEFMLRKLLSLRDKDDLKYYLRAAGKVLGHIFDFNRKKEEKRCSGR
ncbi:MAG: radical SAM protein [Candidatus Omnitrophica bacterium]|nr:radical SAM protein [Candidatus Omnitrophota bacterium]